MGRIFFFLNQIQAVDGKDFPSDRLIFLDDKWVGYHGSG